MTMIREPETWHEDWCNFTPDEFRCSCCNRLEISSDIMDLLQKARNELGPLQITSAYRCPEHNSKVSLLELLVLIQLVMLLIFMSLILNIEKNLLITLQQK